MIVAPRTSFLFFSFLFNLFFLFTCSLCVFSDDSSEYNLLVRSRQVHQGKASSSQSRKEKVRNGIQDE